MFLFSFLLWAPFLKLSTALQGLVISLLVQQHADLHLCLTAAKVQLQSSVVQLPARCLAQGHFSGRGSFYGIKKNDTTDK